jgi:hypothetical protein
MALINDPGDMSDVADRASRDDDELLKEEKAKKSILNTPKKKVAQRVRRRWDRLDKVMRQKQVELKVNHLRYLGNEYAQISPRDPNRIILPVPAGKRAPPVINKIRRSVHRYVAQVTSDEPVIEALPASHTDEDRDAAEAATHTLRGEWERMKLQREFQRVTQMAAIYRSGFWFFEWNPTDGGRQPAHKFFPDEKGGQQLKMVNAQGEPVENPEEAAKLWKGNTKVEVMTPMNVRWNGSRYAHEAKELMVAKMPRLRDIYESFPETRKLPLSDLVGHEPPQGEKWLQDIRAENFKSGSAISPDMNLDETTGGDLEEMDTILDHPVFLMHYFLTESRKLPEGAHVILVGKHIAFRGPRRHGVMPVAQFKLLDEMTDPLGLGLVDMLKDPQELLTFVNSQILRHMQMLRRRWFVPQQANVNARDLSNPDKTTIIYNARAGAKPEAETQPELNQSIFEFRRGAEEDYNDMLGIHDLSQGKQVPGVQSGRHAEALQAGDATLLGLTRTQLQAALEHSGLVLLNIVKKEWTTERRVRYFGDGRTYIDKAFKRADFRDTADVRLDKSSLLMLTKAQKMEMLFSFAEVGAILPAELRRLAPLGDTAGISLSEDDHVMKARREGEKLLAGPPPEAVQAYEEFTQTMQSLNTQAQAIGKAGITIQDPAEVQVMQEAVAMQAQEAEEAFDGVMSNVLGIPNVTEQMPNIVQLHIEEHAKDRASQKVDALPTWWVDWWDQNHFAMHLMAIAPPPQPGGPAPPETGGGELGPDEMDQLSNPGATPPPSEAGAAANRDS